MAGDIIRSITVDDTEYEVTRIFHVVDSMLNARVGSVVKVKLLRGTEEVTVTFNILKGALTKWD